MSFTRPLFESDSVVLDGSGGGTVRMRPDGSRERWLPVTAAVKTNETVPVKEAQCTFYSGQTDTDNYFVDQTFSGSSGDSTGRIEGHEVSRTQDAYVIAVWKGGTPGATATLTLRGTKVTT